jgi:hypothetical protein
MESSLLQHLDKLPPCLVRLIARDPEHRGRRLSLVAIAERAGLSYGTVRRLSLKKTWANEPLKKIEAFSAACGVNLLRQRRKLFYLNAVLKHPNGYKLLGAHTGPSGAVLKVLRNL